MDILTASAECKRHLEGFDRLEWSRQLRLVDMVQSLRSWDEVREQLNHYTSLKQAIV